MSRQVLKDPAEVSQLAQSLRNCAAVAQFDTDGEEQAWTLAHALGDLEESFRTVVDGLLPKLVRTNDSREVESVLHEIGEEFRHVLYHLHDCRFYGYLLWNKESRTGSGDPG